MAVFYRDSFSVAELGAVLGGPDQLLVTSAHPTPYFHNINRGGKKLTGSLLAGAYGGMSGFLRRNNMLFITP